MNLRCIKDLLGYLKNHPKISSEILTITPELCPPSMEGDITVNCFRFSRNFKGRPDEFAETVTTFLRSHSDVIKVDSVKAFVNVTLSPIALFRDTVANPAIISDSTLIPSEKTQKILLEFSAPNTNKPQHLGHVRNNVLGMAICSILKRVGHKVTAVNLINDRGIHICKSMTAYQRFPSLVEQGQENIKGDHLVGEYYVKFDQELRHQITNLKSNQLELRDVPSAEMFLKTEIGMAAQQMLQRWEKGDLETRVLWQKLNCMVLQGFEETYKRLGVNFDHTYYESETYKIGKDLILRGMNSTIFSQNRDGSIQVDLSDEKLGEKIVLRKDGTSVYVTQDIGTSLLKYEDFKPGLMVWIVGDEQIHHFNVLFAILKKMGFSWAQNLRHIPYGMVNLPSGKMKSREGTVVDADDLFDEMFTLAKEATLERCGESIPEDLDDRAHIISMGALKYMLLKFNPRSSISFDPSASIKFEGDTGPYIQYAYARIASILRKNNEEGMDQPPDWSLLGEPEERLLALQCALFENALHKSAEEFDTSTLAAYLLSLTKEFNRFYKKHSVLSPDSPGIKRARLELCIVVQKILKDGLQTLNIDTLESM